MRSGKVGSSLILHYEIQLWLAVTVIIRTMQQESYYWFREMFLKSELEFAKLVIVPRWERLPPKAPNK